MINVRSCILPLLAIGLALSGCSTRGGSIPYDRANFGAPDAPPPARDLADYKLSPGDVVTIQVFELPQLAGDQTVDGVGRINPSLVGPVQADGLTVAQLSTALSTKLQEKYLQSPHVSVVLKTAVQHTVTVDGAVEHPGIFPIGASTTLIQTIALASGTRDDANAKRVVVFRVINGAREAASFDLTTIRSGKDGDPLIYPNDVVVVDGSSIGPAFKTVLRTVPLLAFFTRL